MALSCALVVGAMLSRSGTQQPHLRRSTTLAQHLQSLLLLLFFIHACIDSCRHSFTDYFTHSLNYSLIHSFASHSHQLVDCLIGCFTDCLMPRLCIFFCCCMSSVVAWSLQSFCSSSLHLLAGRNLVSLAHSLVWLLTHTNHVVQHQAFGGGLLKRSVALMLGLCSAWLLWSVVASALGCHGLDKVASVLALGHSGP